MGITKYIDKKRQEIINEFNELGENYNNNLAYLFGGISAMINPNLIGQLKDVYQRKIEKKHNFKIGELSDENYYLLFSGFEDLMGKMQNSPKEFVKEYLDFLIIHKNKVEEVYSKVKDLGSKLETKEKIKVNQKVRSIKEPMDSYQEKAEFFLKILYQNGIKSLVSEKGNEPLKSLDQLIPDIDYLT